MRVLWVLVFNTGQEKGVDGNRFNYLNVYTFKDDIEHYFDSINIVLDSDRSKNLMVLKLGFLYIFVVSLTTFSDDRLCLKIVFGSSIDKTITCLET